MKEITVLVSLTVDDDVWIGKVNDAVLKKLTGKYIDNIDPGVYFGTATVRNANVVNARNNRGKR